MNYRHHFHAGNFADLQKHALLTALISALKVGGTPLTVFDTHAGAGVYDLKADAALRSGEAEAGVARLWAENPSPAVFGDLLAVVRRLNPKGLLRLYPGSPALCAALLGSGDRYVGCELRPEEAQLLDQTLKSAAKRDGPALEARLTDGYSASLALRPDPDRKWLVLIDPPYEQGDDYVRLVETAAGLRRLKPAPVVAIWAPIKDLETFDALLRRLEDVEAGPGLAAQARLRPLLNPMKMNGSAMIILGQAGLEASARAASEWVVRHVGEPGGAVRITTL